MLTVLLGRYCVRRGNNEEKDERVNKREEGEKSETGESMEETWARGVDCTETQVGERVK